MFENETQMILNNAPLNPEFILPITILFMIVMAIIIIMWGLNC